MTASIVIGVSSGLLLIVFVCAVNLVLRYVREIPVTEYDMMFVRWCLLFAAVAFLLNGVL
jgi:hypothetical protein